VRGGTHHSNDDSFAAKFVGGQRPRVPMGGETGSSEGRKAMTCVGLGGKKRGLVVEASSHF
jgi:hypothetical protein